MTVELNDTFERYTISGVGPYPFSFRIFDSSEIAAVAQLGTLAIPLTLSSNYSVDVDGRSVTLASASASAYAGYTLDIRSNTQVKQPASVRNQGRFLPEIHEDAFDRTVRMLQDMSRR